MNILKSSITLIKENHKVAGQLRKPSIAFIKEIHKIVWEIHSQVCFPSFAGVNTENFH